MSMRGMAFSLVRQAHVARRTLVMSASSSFSSSVSAPLWMPSAGNSSNRKSCHHHHHHHQQQQQQQQQQLQLRAGLSTLRRASTGPLSARLRLPMRGLGEFRDPEIVKSGDVPIVGRHWTVPELRKKSFEDLHKLWFVLYKEKNMLLTELALCRRTKALLPAGDRRQKVKRSMKAIKVVVGERQRAKRAIRRERQLVAKREQREEEATALEAGSAAPPGDVAFSVAYTSAAGSDGDGKASSSTSQ